MRIVVGISGSSGAIYGTRLVKVLADLQAVETELIISDGARATIAYENPCTLKELLAMADRVHDDSDLTAPPASGTFLTNGMVIAPCSMKTLAAIATGYADTLLVRVADVTLKERRKLVLVPRETPLHLGHLRNMVTVTEIGAVVLPPVPGFYNRPQSIADLVDHTVTKILDQFGIDAGLTQRWRGIDSQPFIGR